MTILFSFLIFYEKVYFSKVNKNMLKIDYSVFIQLPLLNCITALTFYCYAFLIFYVYFRKRFQVKNLNLWKIRETCYYFIGHTIWNWTDSFRNFFGSICIFTFENIMFYQRTLKLKTTVENGIKRAYTKLTE